jgi:hypothetical protein
VAGVLIWRVALCRGVVAALVGVAIIAVVAGAPTRAGNETDLHPSCGSIVAHRPKPSRRNRRIAPRDGSGGCGLPRSCVASAALSRDLGLTRAPAAIADYLSMCECLKGRHYFAHTQAEWTFLLA